MLNNPPINELEQKAGCRYLLVSAVAKRAREIMKEKHGDKDNKIPGISDNEALDEAVDEFYGDQYRIAGETAISD
ncbi:MAG: DNA-directed RNA polymerase subunit omega [Clostridia bacterium]|nr:DNA-directed RNA polymerase subunit omega [Clostridia bacterium]